MRCYGRGCKPTIRATRAPVRDGRGFFVTLNEIQTFLIDVDYGMLFSNIVMLSIILSTGTVLFCYVSFTHFGSTHKLHWHQPYSSVNLYSNIVRVDSSRSHCNCIAHFKQQKGNGRAYKWEMVKYSRRADVSINDHIRNSFALFTDQWLITQTDNRGVVCYNNRFMDAVH